MIIYYRDKITGHLLELKRLVDMNTGAFHDHDDKSRVTAQFSSPWLEPLSKGA